jgi:hypothetical protein
MTPRRRLIGVLAGLALLVGTVIALREDQPEPPPPRNDALVLPDFTAPYVVSSTPAQRPQTPVDVRVRGGPDRLRVSWGSSVQGAADPARAAGYEVTWHRGRERPGTRLVASTEVQLGGLASSTEYEVGVRSVDAFGQRSAQTTVRGRTGDEGDWRSPLTGLLDEFADTRSLNVRRPGSLWHLSSHRGCVETGPDRKDEHAGRLVFELNCGADTAVLRARRPLVLSDVDGVLGKVAVVTDAAGPHGQLVVDLVPGTADRIGAGTTPAEAVDPALPGGAIRVLVSDSGTRVITGPDVPRSEEPQQPVSPRRGSGVLHRFEVVLTTGGMRVLQDGAVVATSSVVPSWREAAVLVGASGPAGRQSRVHLDAIGFSGPQHPPPAVTEIDAALDTQRVLDVDEQAPGVGISRALLRGASAARLRATVVLGTSGDPAGMVVQLGDVRVPAVAATSAWSRKPGTVLTVVADVPPELLADAGPDSLRPFVLRMPGAAAGPSSLVESYLEITGPPRETDAGESAEISGAAPKDALPPAAVEFRDTAGVPLAPDQPMRRCKVVLQIDLDGLVGEAPSGSVEGVAGFQVRVDNRLAASVPTARDGPGLGGSYPLLVDFSKLSTGHHVVEVRVYAVDRVVRELSVLRDLATIA